MPFPLIFEEDLWSFGLGVNSASKDRISFWTPHLSVCLQFSFIFSCWMSIVRPRPSPLTSTGPCFGRHIAGILRNNSSCPSNLSLVFLDRFLVCPQGIQNVMSVYNIVYNVLYYIVVTIIFEPNKKFILTCVGWRSYFRFRISKGW